MTAAPDEHLYAEMRETLHRWAADVAPQVIGKSEAEARAIMAWSLLAVLRDLDMRRLLDEIRGGVTR